MIRNPVNAILNYNYFCMNFNLEFIKECWAHDPHLQNWLSHKFKQVYDAKGTAVIPFFMMELDSDNQVLFIKWINNNYVAFNYLKD